MYAALIVVGLSAGLWLSRGFADGADPASGIVLVLVGVATCVLIEFARKWRPVTEKNAMDYAGLGVGTFLGTTLVLLGSLVALGVPIGT